MFSEMTKTIEGKTIFGEPRKCTFKIMDAETGGELFHEFASIVSVSWDTIAPIVKKFFKGDPSEDIDQRAADDEPEGIPLEDILKILPTIFDWPTIKRVSADMLAGAEIVLPDTVGKVAPHDFHTIGEDGICNYAVGDPLEQYLVLFHAICANYPKYISFLGLSLDSDQPNGAETTND